MDNFHAINVDPLPAIQDRLNHPTFFSFSTVFGSNEVVAVVTADLDTTANWLNRVLEDPGGEKIVGFATIGLASAPKQASVIALSYCNNVLIYKVKEAVQSGLVPPQFHNLLDNADVKLVGVNIVRHKAALTKLGFKVGSCEFLNIAHNLTAQRETFSHATMFDILAEHLDLRYQDELPRKLQSDVLNDRECILLSLYSFGAEEVYARLTKKSAEISVLANFKNRFLIQMGPKNPHHFVVATIVSADDASEAKSWVRTVLDYNPNGEVPIGFFMGHMSTPVHGTRRPAVVSFYSRRCCLILKIGAVVNKDLSDALTLLLGNDRVVLIGEQAPLNRAALSEIPCQIPLRGSGCGTRNAAGQLVGDRRKGLGYELNMIHSLGLGNFGLMEDYDNNWGNKVLSDSQVITAVMKSIAPIVTTGQYGDKL